MRTVLGEVEVTSQVVGYLRRLPSGEVLDQVPLDLPVRTLRTRAVWYTIADDEAWRRRWALRRTAVAGYSARSVFGRW